MARRALLPNPVVLRRLLAAHALIGVDVEQILEQRLGAGGEGQVLDGRVGLAAADVSEQAVLGGGPALAYGVPIRERGFTRE